MKNKLGGILAPKTRTGAEALLAAVIIVRSVSLLFSKIALQNMGPLTLLGVRFLLAFALLACIFFKRLLGVKKKTFFHGMLLGLAFFGVMSAELFGLRSTSSCLTSFLENTAIVLVPLFNGILRRKLPTAPALVSAGTALLGVALLTIQGGSFALTRGEWLCLLAAVLYAGAIILTHRLSHEDDPLPLGILQVGFVGLFGLMAAFLFETPRLPATEGEWGAVLVLSLVCSGFGFTLQPVAQSGTTAERAGLFCALNPLTAAVLGRLFLNERLGLTGLVGAALVLLSMVISALFKEKAPGPNTSLARG